MANIPLSVGGVNGGLVWDEYGVVWDSIGAVWEETTSGGPTTITIDSIDNVYPIWEITGPAYNPTLSNTTTGGIISYAGNVASGQTLTIDMNRKTAKLNGTSVIGNVSGDWLYLQPGNNRMTFVTDNLDTPNSKLRWQEIVG